MMDDNDVPISDDQEMGHRLNTLFASVFTTEYQGYLRRSKTIFHGNEADKLISSHISPCVVKAKLLKLKMTKAPGVDFVGMRMLTELAEEISYTVAELFYKSLLSGKVPTDWKLANVTPNFKKGKKSSVANYRPVSLTVNLCKVFESIMRDKMIEHLVRYKLIKGMQHGFVKK